LLRRTSINFVNNTLSKKANWKIADIGCGYSANINASVIADIQDLSNFYKGKNFIKISGKKLPFKDKEFDFVIASHVIEHVEDFEFFVKELERISPRGYIELPTRLGDNLVFENKTDHIWWFIYDDTNNLIIASKRNQLLDPFITVSMAKIFEKIFRESLVIELAWEERIEYKIDNKIREEDLKKISFFKLIRKYFRNKININKIYKKTKVDMWFLKQIKEIIDVENILIKFGIPKNANEMNYVKSIGFGDEKIAKLTKISAESVKNLREKLNVLSVYKKIDTCAAEFKSVTPYMYSTYQRDSAGTSICESEPTKKKK